MNVVFNCNKKIAEESLDHTDPCGTINDNSTNPSLISELSEYFSNKKNINFLDVGCAGGQFVIDMMTQKFTKHCFGIEGSDNVLHGAGENNWKSYFNKNLFLCDAVEPYSFSYQNKKIYFDVIFSSDVIEHIDDDKIDNFIDNMLDLLKPDGIIVLSIGLCKLDPRHVTVYSIDGWNERLSKYNVVPYLFENTLRLRNDNTYFLCIKK